MIRTKASLPAYLCEKQRQLFKTARVTLKKCTCARYGSLSDLTFLCKDNPECNKRYGSLSDLTYLCKDKRSVIKGMVASVT